MKGHQILALLVVGGAAYWLGHKRGVAAQVALDQAALTPGGQAANAATNLNPALQAGANPLGTQLQNLQNAASGG